MQCVLQLVQKPHKLAPHSPPGRSPRRPRTRRPAPTPTPAFTGATSHFTRTSRPVSSTTIITTTPLRLPFPAPIDLNNVNHRRRLLIRRVTSLTRTTTAARRRRRRRSRSRSRSRIPTAGGTNPIKCRIICVGTVR